MVAIKIADPLAEPVLAIVGRLDWIECRLGSRKGAFVKRTGELDADGDELPLLTERVPEAIKRRVLERHDAFRTLPIWMMTH